MSRRGIAVACALFAGAIAAPARAQDATAAQALFDDAKRLMEDGRFDAACPKLEESQRLDPAGGTLLHLALCYERWGKTASAWSTYNEALGKARADGRADREDVAVQQLAALEPKLSYLIVEVSPDAAALAGLTVEQGGRPVAAPRWGTPVPTDPGRYEIVARAPNHETFTQQLEVSGEGQTLTVSIPALTPAASGVVAPPDAELGAAPPAEDGDTQRTIGFVVGGVGLAGVAVGAIFGVVALSNKSDAETHCRDGFVCDAEGVELVEDGIAAGNASTVAFAIGGAAVLAGAILVLTAPDGTSAEVGMSADRAWAKVAF